MTTKTNAAITTERMVIREILQSLAEKEMEEKAGQSPGPPGPMKKADSQTGWLEFVAREMAALPWFETILPDGRTPPQPKAAVALIGLLATSLESNTISPSSINTTWAGGVAVEWHVGGIDLEIYCQPDGTAEFSFEDTTGEELEGPVPGNTTCLTQLARRLPASR